MIQSPLKTNLNFRLKTSMGGLQFFQMIQFFYSCLNLDLYRAEELRWTESALCISKKKPNRVSHITT